MVSNTERQVIELVAADRIDRPISSMSGKFKRRKPKLAQALGMSDGDKFAGDRAYARVETTELQKARGMREGIALFKQKYERHGRLLQEIIDETRRVRETHMYFGMQPDKRIPQTDYMAVMTGLGFSETRAEAMYQELMNVSRNLAKKRKEGERRILVDSTL